MLTHRRAARRPRLISRRAARSLASYIRYARTKTETFEAVRAWYTVDAILLGAICVLPDDAVARIQRLVPLVSRRIAKLRARTEPA